MKINRLSLKGYNLNVINIRSMELIVSVRIGYTALVLAVVKSLSLI